MYLKLWVNIRDLLSKKCEAKAKIFKPDTSKRNPNSIFTSSSNGYSAEICLPLPLVFPLKSRVTKDNAILFSINRTFKMNNNLVTKRSRRNTSKRHKKVKVTFFQLFVNEKLQNLSIISRKADKVRLTSTN